MSTFPINVNISSQWAQSDNYISGNPMTIYLPVDSKVAIYCILSLAGYLTVITIRAGTVPGAQEKRIMRKELIFMYKY